MKFLLLLTIFVAFASCEVKIDERFSNAKSVSTLRGKKLEGKFEKRIATESVAGRAFELGNFPYYTLLYLVDEVIGDIYFASGSLIHHEWILTTATALLPPLAEAHAYLGIVTRPENLTRTPESAQWYSGALLNTTFNPHPQFSDETGVNNVGLLKIPLTKTIFDGLSHVAVISLPTSEDKDKNFVGEKGSAYGFGIEDFIEFSYSYELKEAKDLQILPMEECKAFYESDTGSDDVFLDYFCALNTAAQSVCDEGGPFVTSIDGVSTQIGVTLMTLPHCLSSEFPIMYFRITSHLQWIEETTSSSAAIKWSVGLSIAAVLALLIK